MTPNIYPFGSNNLPPSGEILIADTSFIIELWGRSNKPALQQECQSFINELANRGIYFATTIKTHEELRINTTANVLGKKRDRKQVLNAGSKSMGQVVNRTKQIENAFRKLSNYYPEAVGTINQDILTQADDYMRRFNIEYGDAVIYAICTEEGLNNIITLDGDYNKINDNNLNIYTNTYKYRQLTKDRSNSTSP